MSSTEIRKWLHANRNEMIAFLEDLVSIPSENPPGNRYPECAERIRAQLERLAIECELVRVESANELPRVGVIGRSNADRALVFHGHYDVVPAQDPSTQFAPRIANGTMFGRGTSDMKGGLVAMIYAKRALQELDAKIADEILLTMVPDEETGGRLGSEQLFQQRLPHPEIAGMLMPEPTSGVVWNANRGAITLDVTIHGRAAHVGLQHQGINAFEQMVHVVNRLLVLKREVEQRRTAFPLVPDARNSILLLGGTAKAGMNFNVVPASAQFTIDRRINPEEDFDREWRVLHELLDEARNEGIDLQVATIQEGRPSSSSENGDVARALATSIANVKGKAPAFELCPGLLEIRFFAARGVPSFAYGPGVLAVSHGPQEYVKLDEVVNCAAIYAETAVRVFDRY